MDEQELLRKFGDGLKRARKAKGMSQLTLGLECDLSQTYISEVEAGKRNVSLVNIYKLAKELGLTVAQLVEGVELSDAPSTLGGKALDDDTVVLIPPADECECQ